ncbi:MAG: M55 family metallopeptidase [Pseudomonadales bacterium]
MKVYISVDMEGISGLVRWMDVATQGIDFELNRSLMTLDANAAIEGAYAAGATEVVVEENHGVQDLCILKMDEIDPRCSVIRGAGRPGASTMVGLDESIGVVLLVGHHAKAGTFPGLMAHTISGGWFKRVRLHGSPIGEPDMFAIRAGELGVPVGMVSGDQVVAAEVLEICPWVETAILKHAYAKQAARVIPPARARPIITEAAKKAVERAMKGELEIYTAVAAPYEFEVELTKDIPDTMRANLDQLEEFEILNDRLVRVSAPDMSLGFRRVAYLGYAEGKGVTRY